MAYDPYAQPTRDDVVHAYHLLLGREPESELAIASHLAQPNCRALVRGFLESREFASRAAQSEKVHLSATISDRIACLLADFAPNPLPDADSEHWVDALGVRTRTAFLAEWKNHGGRVIADPEEHSQQIEWLALLDALSTACARFCAIELGAGFGPWLVRAGVACRLRWPNRPFLLVGVEAEPVHFEYLRQHVTDNGLPAQSLRLLHAAVSDRDGEAEFEVSNAPAEDWGTRLVDGPAQLGLPRPPKGSRVRVPVVSLHTVTEGLAQVDFLHVDIQGTEVIVLAAAADVLRTRVSRLIVGTHGRGIEARLMELLVPLGFHLHAEQACRYRLDTDPPLLIEDGAQYWINGRLCHT